MDSMLHRPSSDIQVCDPSIEVNSMHVFNDSDYTPNLMVDKSQRVKMWQQTHYLSDSGIHSAVGTHTPSVSSKLSTEETDTDERCVQQKPGQLQTWSTSFPLSVNPADSSLLSPATPSTSSILGIDSLSDAVGGSHSASNLDLRGNKLPEIDTDEAASAIPELVKLIKDEDDQVIIYQSAMMVFQLSKSEAIDALIKSWDMLSCIIGALDRTEDPETVRFLAGTLYNISQTQIGLKAIFAANCIPCLVKLLNSPVESVLFYAITTLHNLLLHQNGAKAIVRQSGCLQKMIVLLRKNNIKFLTICTDCLQILAYGHQESKLQVLSSGGPVELVRILRTYQYEKLLWTTARVLKVLSVCPSNKPAIIAAGGMDALTKHLHSSSHRLVLNCLWALRNLSDAATRLDNLQPLLHSLVRLLDCGDSNMVTCAAGIISNLTCNNHANKYIVYKIGGIHYLLKAVSQPGAKEDILEPCMCALRHLTSRHEEEETARHVIVHELNGLPVIARILHATTAGICPDLELVCQPPQNPVTSWMLVKAIIGLLRNLSVNLDTHYGMRECGLVTGLFFLLYATQCEIVKRFTSTNTSPQPHFSTIVQSVRLEEIIEGICGALHMLAKDHTTRGYLAQLKAPNLHISPNIQPGYSGLAIFVELLHSPHESIQRAAAGVLAEVSQDRNGLEALVNLPGASSRFDELVHSRNEAISTYASAVVIRLAEERRGITETPYIFPSHVESLNTPPLPMDTEVYQIHPTQNISPSGMVAVPPPHSGWSHHTTSQPVPHDPSMISGSPPPNSLIAMLGPPPSDYKNSVCNECCSYWGDCGPEGVCSDPNCIYSNQCRDSYPDVERVKAYPAACSNRSVMSGSSSTYTQLDPSFPSLTLQSSYEPANSTVPVSSLNALPSESTVRRSGVCSMDTSGYISPTSDIYVHSSPSGYKPACKMRQTQLKSQAPTADSSTPPTLPQQSLSAGYLSPELIAMEESNASWLGASGPL